MKGKNGLPGFVGIIIYIFAVFYAFETEAQITKIAGFDSDIYTNPGLFGTDGQSVFRYSWYYDDWYELPRTGFNPEAEIKAIAVADSGYSYVSGIYVLADTAIYTYSWWDDEWLSFPNTGLNRLNGIAQISDVTVYGKGTSMSDHEVYAVSAGEVFEYVWYYNYWYSRGGLNKTDEFPTSESSMTVFPNPVSDQLQVSVNLPENYSGQLQMSVFNTSGKLIDILNFEIDNATIFEYEYTHNLPAGMYFCEITAGKSKFVRTIIVRQ